MAVGLVAIMRLEHVRSRPRPQTCLIWIAVMAMTGGSVAVSTDRRVPQIESNAPGAFDDPDRPAVAEVRFRYQVNASIFIPLVLVSIPIGSRDDLGVASAAARDFALEDGTRLRTYEFFAASSPERARGLNRLGFLREAVLMGPDGVHWTAHFGVVSATREATREEAEEHLDREERVERYTILDGFTDPTQTWSTTVQLDLEGQWPTADALYADLRKRWAVAEPDEETTLQNEGGRTYLEPVGFLGALQHSLRVAAADATQLGTPRRFRYAFVHNGKAFYLDLSGHSVDDGRRQRYVQAHLVGAEALVHKLDYHIADAEGDRVQSFELWTELPRAELDPLTPPILPVAFEFKARSFLKLRVVRTLEPSLNVAEPTVGEDR